MDINWRYDEEHGAAVQAPWQEHIMHVVPLSEIPLHAPIWKTKYSKGCSACIVGYCLEVSLEEFLKT